MAEATQVHRAHRVAQAGPNSAKAKGRERHKNGFNPKAFIAAHPFAADKQVRRNAELDQQRLHVPMVNRTPESEPPPIIIAIVGPQGVGKSTLMRSLIRRYTKHTIANIAGPVTVVAGKARRLTFIECNNDINSMIDVGKIADLVLLMIDGSFGFEMETMEFLNILQAHGFPKVMGILTHLDLIKKPKTLRATKKRLKHRFWTEIYQGAKLFYLSGVINGRYPDVEIQNLCRFISVMKFRPLAFRNSHPYFLVDRMEELTPRDLVTENPKMDRTITVYGYVRGTPLRNLQPIHIPGMGDLNIASIESLNDPCPLPTQDSERRRRLSDKAKLIHAPMSDVGGVMFDKDAVYINVPGHFSKRHGEDAESIGEGERMIMDLQDAKNTLGDHAERGDLRLLGESDTPVQLERARRPAFNDDAILDEDQDDDDDDHQSDEEDSDSDQQQKFKRRLLDEDDQENMQDDEIAYAESDSDMEMGEEVPRWKTNLAQHAHDTFLANRSREANLMKRIYDSDETPEQIAGYQPNDHIDDAEGMADDFLKLVSRDIEQSDDVVVPEASRATFFTQGASVWDDEDQLDSIRPLFITGDIDSNQHEEHQLDHAADPQEAPDASREQTLAEKKAELKRKFDEQYDDGSDQDNEDDWYTTQKRELARQNAMNEAEFAEEDPSVRTQVAGFRSGTYVRVELKGIPCEFVEHFDPHYPVIVGGLNPNETALGFLQARIKRHRWHKKILKTNDPLILSIGWRRYQSMPIYTMDDGTRNRMLKYTPEHMHCLASFYGPAALPNTGFCAFNTLSSAVPGFRISATGVITGIDSGNGASHRIVKKLKLTGTPAKVFKNTAFIKDMFNSKLEVARFEGAQIKTVSGVRGQVKKALSQPEGQFRAAFEDKILMSDIVFLRAWYNVVPRKFYNPVTSLLLNPEQGREWNGMRLTGIVRRDEGIKTPLKVNSTYKKVERPEERRFAPLRVPKSLQAVLPYSSKPHVTKPQRKPTYLQKRAVVMEKDERNTVALLQQMQAVQHAKTQKRMQKRQEKQAERTKQLEKKANLTADKQKERMKAIYKQQGQRAAKKSKS
ncbi:Glycoside hydrolase 2 (Mannanase, beta-galactosidase) [Malassezia psittaci]|uniref:Glycoside hydrolase 2 (Mannanase, beta-galactosidase) n=1 Tax=Malassezia psittaci TaxID=1821823 RepID=A0AAF0FBI1_9BASI|nr:Glycoside hydrolase 2 (Mannanase, beta-galactosidase) [Malassezia psittaci]